MVAIVAIFINFNYLSLAYAKNQLQDPTMPKNLNIEVDQKNAKDLGELSLTAILVNANNKTAIINNQVVHEKDEIAKHKILAIEANKVILKKIINKFDNEVTSKLEAEKDIAKDKIVEIKLPAMTIKE